MKTLAAITGLCLLLLAFDVSLASGTSTPDTLPKVKSCLTEHGARDVFTQFFATGEDAEENATSNLISGYKGTVSGTFHGDDFQVDIYDDVYLNGVGGSRQDFEPLASCYDVFGPSPLG
jgi:hypothetical protein